MFHNSSFILRAVSILLLTVLFFSCRSTKLNRQREKTVTEISKKNDIKSVQSEEKQILIVEDVQEKKIRYTPLNKEKPIELITPDGQKHIIKNAEVIISDVKKEIVTEEKTHVDTVTEDKSTIDVTEQKKTLNVSREKSGMGFWGYLVILVVCIFIVWRLLKKK